jgi:hypothetical protein
MNVTEADKLAHGFATAMQAKPHLRPSGTRRGGDVDTLNGFGAAHLAKKIENFWRNAGFDGVRVEIIPFIVGGGTVYALRSNLVAGLPRSQST